MNWSGQLPEEPVEAPERPSEELVQAPAQPRPHFRQYAGARKRAPGLTTYRHWRKRLHPLRHPRSDRRSRRAPPGCRRRRREHLPRADSQETASRMAILHRGGRHSSLPPVQRTPKAQSLTSLGRKPRGIWHTLLLWSSFRLA